MKKYIVTLFLFFLFGLYFPAKLISQTKLFDSYGINFGLNTFKLLGNLSSVQSQNIRTNNVSGGGLSFIEPGIDFSVTFFTDSNLRHRVVVGGEYIWMNSREVTSISYYIYNYSYHRVQFFDIYSGYHYAFWKAPYQNVKVYAGAELMLNNTTLNELDRGIIYIQNPTSSITNLYAKSSSMRLGGRIRAGFEGRLYEQLYINASFALGVYNLLLRDDSTGELFNSPNSLEKKESFQPFFNYLISFQYRFE